MWRPSGWELLIILVIILLIFGPGRIGKIGGEIGKGIRSLRDGLSGKTDEDKSEAPPKDKDKDKD